MEALYKKLYNKYDALKKKRISELDEFNKDQEVKFLNYVSAAEELIQHLKGENERLCAQISELRSQVGSIRSAKENECGQYQNLLMEESEKNKMLSEEVERLQKLEERLSFSSKDDKNEIVQLNMLQTAQVTSHELSDNSMRRMTRKRSREARAEMESVTTPAGSDKDDLLVRGSAKHSSRVESATTSARSDKDDVLVRGSAKDISSADLENEEQPGCCGRTIQRTADCIKNDSDSTNCQFQALTECLLGMKFFTVRQNESICISAQHLSSGYSFILTWVKKEAGEEPELLYHVLTLGTFDRIAPEWMRSVLMFSTGMCPIFFERVARVIKMHH